VTDGASKTFAVGETRPFDCMWNCLFCDNHPLSSTQIPLNTMSTDNPSPQPWRSHGFKSSHSGGVGIAMADGTSQWITGPEARAHGHAMRARADCILVGGGTLRADAPRLDVRLSGLEQRSPARWVLTSGAAPEGWQAVSDARSATFDDAQYLLIEGGAGSAAAFLAADRVDRLLLYRAPILLGGGGPGIGDIGLSTLADAHGRWQLMDRRRLGSDTLDVYDRTR
jgi:diaminohydroxyphosphoribosylaminopyrimidine deaminase/5-amino-6-(5-phosphoribosylamino)uracil reductase